MDFPKLFSKSSNGQSREWSIYVNSKGQIITKYGVIGGKLVTTFREVTQKNLGKQNETTLFEQAVSEAQSKWNKKIDEGYKTSISSAMSPKKCITLLPMLALNYETRHKDISFPCFVQPKIDGIRAIFYNNSLWSRLNKQFINFEHITDEIKANFKGINLDGELYSPDLTFEELSGLTRKVELEDEDLKNILKVNLIVYDYVSDNDYKDRLTTLQKMFNKNTRYLTLLQTETCLLKSDIETFLNKYVSQGYEGLIIRNKLGPYTCKYRSKNLQKYKLFIDDEFKIVDFTDGKGIESGLIIYVCETKNRQRFTVRPKGTHEKRAKLFKIGKTLIGKFLTVRFQQYTDCGIPRFPVGISIRDYE